MWIEGQAEKRVTSRQALNLQMFAEFSFFALKNQLSKQLLKKEG